jgi:NADPH:quinone reductase-like Zn-dependent oxidoreductase
VVTGKTIVPAAKNARVVITRLGGPDVLQWVEEDMPSPGPGQVLVKVLATGVAFADVLMRHGLYPGTPKFPFAPGYDIVGEVDALGDGVSQFAIGQRVASLIMIGGYSCYTVVPANRLVAVPEGLDSGEAVSLVLNYVTAYQMIHRVAKLRESQRILIHAAAGGVGTATLQLGKIAGLEMFGTASKAKHALVTSLGAKPIDYRSENFVERLGQLAPGGVDAVFDPIGGKNWWSSYQCLRRGGSLVCYGSQAALSEGKLSAGIGFALLGLMKLLPDGKLATWYNVNKLSDAFPEMYCEDLTRLFELLAQRKVHPVVAARFPLREAARANDLVERAQVSGKVVLFCQE